MEILIFTDSAAVKSVFDPLTKKKNISAEIYPVSGLKNTVSKKSSDIYVYYDISSLDEKSRKNGISFLAKLPNIRYSIIDPKNSITDTAAEFFLGCSDYLGKNVFKEKITLKRIEESLKYKPFNILEDSGSNDKTVKIKKPEYAKFSGNSWENIKTGTEYAFAFLYFEFTNISKLTKQMGAAEVAELLGFFHNYLEKSIQKYQGKIWIWTNTGGIVLFPFDGKNTKAIESALELYFNQPLLKFDDYSKNLDLKLVIHSGNTTYNKRGDTGTIVSDAINSIYHIGQKFASCNCIYATESYCQLLPESLREFFKLEGEFEGNNILSLRKK
ncbi:MAG: hypothetical protein JW982_02140 [Spirochaetes bacterium]|nr:hypothetical protein [Spirochaetota bacterium]